ncbi:MAG: hypothetical protein K8R86_09560 [Bacteroidales bacterium]|nr:hypothetical protein [Bacteroidales bacterium]
MNDNKIRWKEYQRTLIPDIAPHSRVQISIDEVKTLLKRKNIYLLTFISDWDCKNETEYWYVIKDKPEDINEYKSKVRNQINRGIKNCEVKKVNAQFIALNAYEIYNKAFATYNSLVKPHTEKKFRDNMLALSKNPDYDFFAVFRKENDQLIAYAQNKLQDTMVHYTTIKFHPDFLNLYPGYALIHEMNKYYLNTIKLRYVSDGARSLVHETNIQGFLTQKFQFRKSYCRLNVFYSCKIVLFVKVLYPFRIFLKLSDNSIFKSLYVLLKLENIRRSYNGK